MDSTDALSRSRYREWQLNNTDYIGYAFTACVPVPHLKGQKRSKVKEIIVLIKARSFLDELNLEHLTS